MGLHTGVESTVTFEPAPAGRGVVFRRTDLKGRPEVPARLTEVEATADDGAVIRGWLALPDDPLRARCGQTIRNYHPCISRATPFLKLTVHRDRAG